tara:strand:+ start:4620 stop:5603 length:984 start_codon:yes stop_codon:yes gene_type:complete
MINRIKGKMYALFFWQTRIGDVLNSLYGLRIFIGNSFTDSKLKSKENYAAFLTKQYHIIEKGLALPSPRKNFGKAKIVKLIAVATEYRTTYGNDGLTASIMEALASYLVKNDSLATDDPVFYKAIHSFVSTSSYDATGGVTRIDLNELKDAVGIDFKRFVESRASVRNFSDKEVSSEDIVNAVSLARNAPSVCNRQSWKLHYFSDRTTMDKLLKIQNGNNGFGDSINKLLIVTVDTHRFTRLEGNQIFIDGGLFSMNLLLALHSMQIGACCLNTCVPYTDEIEIKKIGEIESSERLIMMMGIGRLKDNYKVALSQKLEADQIITIHE